MQTKDIKTEMDKRLEKLATLRDEARLHLHLASMDAKQEWSDKLEPRIAELEKTVKNVTEDSRATVDEVLERLETFVARLRPRHA